MTKFEMLLLKAIEDACQDIINHPQENKTVIALLKYFLLSEEKYVLDNEKYALDNKKWCREVRFDEGLEQLAKELDCDREEVLQALYILEQIIWFKYGRGVKHRRFLTFEHGEKGKPLKITLFLITEYRDKILSAINKQ
jgi:hypothetical protein